MTDPTLCLGRRNGPRLDDEDTLSQVVLRAEKEAIFASSQRKRAGQQLAAPPAKCQHPSIADELVSSSSITDGKVAEAFKLRIITPALAHAHKARHTIAVLQDPIFVNTTLGQIKAKISAHLGASISSSSIEPPGLRECNCSFPRFIHARGIRSRLPNMENSETSFTAFILIHEKATVQLVDYNVSQQDAITAHVQERFTNKAVKIVGGTLDPAA